MRLGEFISTNREPILMEWEAFARSLAPGAKMGRLALRNDADSILCASVRDMESTQSQSQQTSKSQGHGGAGGIGSDALDDASALHGASRVGAGFNLVQVVSEFRALRASVLRLWRASNPCPNLNDLDDVSRFNECMDQSLANAVAAYTKRVDQIRTMFLAILAHDLRNPLSTISLSARTASYGGELPPDSVKALSQIESSIQAIARLIRDLTDFASTGLGTVIPLTRTPMNLEVLCEEVVREIQAAHPDRQIRCDLQRGNMELMADAARLRQVISNLLGNAMQHGSPDQPVTLSLADESSDLVLSVHNGGEPIPPELLPTIFDPLARGNISQNQRRDGSFGLGLYIVREIITAHAGSVEVSSSAYDGTEFRARIPRLPVEQQNESEV